MRKILLIGLSIFSLQMYADDLLPQGKYLGKGKMLNAAGLNSEYKSSLIIEKNNLQADYVYEDGRKVSYSAELRFSDANFFDIYLGQEKIGSGYLEGRSVHMDIPSKHAEETLYFKDDSVHRIGSMRHGESLLIYTETLLKTKVVMECTGFEHSLTKSVTIETADEWTYFLVEHTKESKQERLIKDVELAEDSYEISPIFGEYKRIIKRGADRSWELHYSCGEVRPLECREY